MVVNNITKIKAASKQTNLYKSASETLVQRQIDASKNCKYKNLFALDKLDVDKPTPPKNVYTLVHKNYKILNKQTKNNGKKINLLLK